MSRKALLLVMFVAPLLMGVTSEASMKKIRFSDISSKEFKNILNGNPADLVVEFRQGDQIPISINAVGDIFETRDSEPNHLVVKRSFFLKFDQMPTLLMSWDGERFVPFKELVGGKFEIGVEGAPASQININLEINEKK